MLWKMVLDRWASHIYRSSSARQLWCELGTHPARASQAVTAEGLITLEEQKRCVEISQPSITIFI